MRALVTGASGFIGKHLLTALHASGWDCAAAGGPDDATGLIPLDLADAQNLRAALDIAAPDVVFHFAGQANVPASIENPAETYDVNVLGVARLLEAIRGYASAGNEPPRVVFASSADVYGKRTAQDLPFVETLAPNPASPYAASKAAAEAVLLGEARSFGLDVVIARTFNCIGPGQSERFAVASFAGQLARIAAGAPPVMEVGDLGAARDFLDVRDGVAAYLALASSGAPGEAYNVCSGVAVTLRDILSALVTIAHVPVEIRQDPARMRPSDVPISYGSNEKLRTATSWQPRIALQQTLRDIITAAPT